MKNGIYRCNKMPAVVYLADFEDYGVCTMLVLTINGMPAKDPEPTRATITDAVKHYELLLECDDPEKAKLLGEYL